MCGKDFVGQYSVFFMPGSPPHVRERRFLSALCFVSTGITPACAGKTAGRMRQQHRDGDHPRMCGKDVTYPIALSNVPGSPPHVRERLP